jgi:hypothetical protein
MDDSGLLQFDYNTNYSYKVKLNSIGESNYTVNSNCEPDSLTYNVEITIQFVTVGDWAAI